MSEEPKVFISLDSGPGQQLVVKGSLSLLDRLVTTLTKQRGEVAAGKAEPATEQPTHNDSQAAHHDDCDR